MSPAIHLADDPEDPVIMVFVQDKNDDEEKSRVMIALQALAEMVGLRKVTFKDDAATHHGYYSKSDPAGRGITSYCFYGPTCPRNANGTCSYQH